MTFLHLYTSGQVQSVHRCEVGFITIFFISLLSSKSKKKKTWWHCFDSSPRVVQAWLYKSYENEIEWSERNFKIFIPNVFTEKKKGEGKKSKKSEWQRKQERRNEIEYWRSVEIRGSSWIASDHRSQRSCPELSNPGFLTHTCNIHRDIFAFHHRRRDAISARLEILRCRNSSISRSFFFFFYTFRNRSCRIEFQRWNIFIPDVNPGILFWIENKWWKKT